MGNRAAVCGIQYARTLVLSQLDCVQYGTALISSAHASAKGASHCSGVSLSSGHSAALRLYARRKFLCTRRMALSSYLSPPEEVSPDPPSTKKKACMVSGNAASQASASRTTSFCVREARTTHRGEVGTFRAEPAEAWGWAQQTAPSSTVEPLRSRSGTQVACTVAHNPGVPSSRSLCPLAAKVAESRRSFRGRSGIDSSGVVLSLSTSWVGSRIRARSCWRDEIRSSG